MNEIEGLSLYNFYIHLYDICYMIVTPTICVIGFFLSFLAFLTLKNTDLKEKIFFDLMVKSFLETFLFCFGALSPLVSCTDCEISQTYSSMVFSLIVYKFLRNGFHLFVTIMEIKITINRYLILKSTEKIIAKKKDKLLIFIFGLIAMLIFSPALFAYEIVRAPLGYTLSNSLFGNSKFFFYYWTFVCLFTNLLTIFVLIPINILVIIKYKKFIRKKNRMRFSVSVIAIAQNSVPKKGDDQTKFTRMIILTTTLFCFTRLCEASIDALNIYIWIAGIIRFYAIYSFILNIFSQFITYLVLSLNFFIYLIFNKKFRDSFKKLFLPK